jgi:hypothetical protein
MCVCVCACVHLCLRAFEAIVVGRASQYVVRPSYGRGHNNAIIRVLEMWGDCMPQFVLYSIGSTHKPRRVSDMLILLARGFSKSTSRVWITVDIRNASLVQQEITVQRPERDGDSNRLYTGRGLGFACGGGYNDR